MKRILDPAKIFQNLYSDASKVQRTASAGLAIKPMGELSGAKRVGKSATIMVYNSDGATLYISFGSQSVTAPTGPGNGIPLEKGEKMFLNSGDDEWIIASSDKAFGYLAISDEIDG